MNYDDMHRTSSMAKKIWQHGLPALPDVEELLPPCNLGVIPAQNSSSFDSFWSSPVERTEIRYKKIMMWNDAAI